MKSGYNDAVLLARKKLENLSAEKVCKICGVTFDEYKYIINWCGKYYDVFVGKTDKPADYNIALEILFLHYLTSEGTKQAENKLTAFREFPGALFYAPKFVQRAVDPLAKRFGREPAKLIEVGEKLGGIKSDESDFAVRINILPNLPVTYIVHEEDEEFEPEAMVLFDKTASGWLPVEDLVVAASFGTYELIKNYK